MKSLKQKHSKQKHLFSLALFLSLCVYHYISMASIIPMASGKILKEYENYDYNDAGKIQQIFLYVSM